MVVSGIWRTLPEVVNKKAAAPNLIHLHPPLYGDRKEATPCQLGNMKPVEPDRMTLFSQARRATKRLYLSNAAKLKATNVIRIDGNLLERAEILTVVSIESTASADLPSWVTVGPPLVWDHSMRAMVERLEPEWNSVTHTITIEGHKGESCLFVDSTDGFQTNAYVKIGDGSGGIPAEYHRIALFHAKTKQEGRYQLPLLQRVARLTIRASNGEAKSREYTWQPDYSLPLNQVDIVLKGS